MTRSTRSTRSTRTTRAALAVAVTGVLALSACGQTADDAAAPSTSTTTATSTTAPTPQITPTVQDPTPEPATPAPGGTPAAPDKPAPEGVAPVDIDQLDLTVVVEDGVGTTTEWTLTCGPEGPGGTHPDPIGACQVLAKGGGALLAPVAADRQCTQQYGGPQTARVSGTWDGQLVEGAYRRTDGCEIGRWSSMVPVLPAVSSGV